MIKITLPGEPIAKIRPRICHNRSYDPQNTLKHAARFQILEMLKDFKLKRPYSYNIPVELHFEFYMTPKFGETKLPEWGIHENVSKKDTDNLIKFYCDVMNGIVYEDDTQVDKIRASKYYDNNPRTEIRIMARRPAIGEKTKEVLCYIPKQYFLDFGEKVHEICNNLKYIDETEQEDSLEAARLLCEFAEQHAEMLNKIKKKFPGFAKLLKEEKDKLEGL